MQKKHILRYAALLLVFVTGSIGAWAQYDPEDPPEPAAMYKITTTVSPAGAGNASGKGSYRKGTVVTINTSRNADFVFKYWTKNGVQYSTSTSFQYSVGTENANFVAVYEYNPNSPSEPTDNYAYRLYLDCTPEGACSFNRASGVKVEKETWVSITAYPSQDFVFQGWYENATKISSNISFQYLMKNQDCHLTAKFIYDPSNPSEPTSSQANVDSNEHASGDVNGDNVTDVSDVVMLVNCYLAGTLSTMDQSLADVNGDGVVDISDVVAIINKYLSNQ